MRRQPREEVARRRRRSSRPRRVRAAPPCRRPRCARRRAGSASACRAGRRQAGGGRCSASPPWNSIACATPARSALRAAKSTMRNDTSLAKIGTARRACATRAACVSRCSSRAAPACGERQQPLEGEAAQRARRDAAGDLRRLDGDGAGAAARVVQRAAGVGAALPAGGRQHRRGQRLLQRRIALVLAPAALEQRLARGVDVQRARARRRGAATSGRSGRRVSTLGRSPVRVAQRSHTASLMRSAAKLRLLQRAALRRGVDAQRLPRRDPVVPVARRARARRGRPRRGTAPSASSTARAAPAGCRRLSAHRVAPRRRRSATPPRSALHRRAPGRQARAPRRPSSASTPRGAGQEQSGSGVAARGATSPCAGWPARSAAPRGTWRRCAARTSMPCSSSISRDLAVGQRLGRRPRRRRAA